MCSKKIKCCDCSYREECDDALSYGYCPNNDDEDYSTAVYREICEQNGEL